MFFCFFSTRIPNKPDYEKEVMHVIIIFYKEVDIYEFIIMSDIFVNVVTPSHRSF